MSERDNARGARRAFSRGQRSRGDSASASRACDGSRRSCAPWWTRRAGIGSTRERCKPTWRALPLRRKDGRGRAHGRHPTPSPREGDGATTRGCSACSRRTGRMRPWSWKPGCPRRWSGARTWSGGPGYRNRPPESKSVDRAAADPAAEEAAEWRWFEEGCAGAHRGPRRESDPVSRPRPRSIPGFGSVRDSFVAAGGGSIVRGSGEWGATPPRLENRTPGGNRRRLRTARNSCRNHWAPTRRPRRPRKSGAFRKGRTSWQEEAPLGAGAIPVGLQGQPEVLATPAFRHCRYFSTARGGVRGQPALPERGTGLP